MAETEFAQANALFVDERFDEALVKFNSCIEKDDRNWTFWTNRANCLLALKKFESALSDADTAIRLSREANQPAPMALVRRGTALFLLDRFTEALDSFQSAATQLGDNENVKRWIRKCEAEIEDQQSAAAAAARGSPVTEPAVATPASTPQPSSSSQQSTTTSVASMPPPTAVPVPEVAVSSQPSQPHAPLSSKVKDSFYQTPSTLAITIFAKDCDPSQASVNVESQQVAVHLVLPDSSVYERTFQLFASVDAPRCTHTLTKFKLEITLHKTELGDWPSLERKETAAEAAARVHTRLNTHDGSIAAYPSSKKKVDWNGIEQAVKQEEEEEKPEGDAALQKLFQKIYGEGNEDVRRAMMKSYQTSGGTVLSTNWKEVESADYEKTREPPTGQEFRSWKNPNG